MASGLQMYDALKAVAAGLADGEPLPINKWDALDLRKLTPGDLIARDYPADLAEQVSQELLAGRFEAFSLAEGIALREQPRAPHLIPGEGFRRMAEFVDENGPIFEQFLENLDRMRHPEKLIP